MTTGGSTRRNALTRGSRSCASRLGELRRNLPAVLVVERRRPERLAPGRRRLDHDLARRAPWPRGHHGDTRGEVDRLVDAVGDEHHGPALAVPQLEQVVVELEARDLV